MLTQQYGHDYIIAINRLNYLGFRILHSTNDILPTLCSVTFPTTLCNYRKLSVLTVLPKLGERTLHHHAAFARDSGIMIAVFLVLLPCQLDGIASGVFTAEIARCTGRVNNKLRSNVAFKINLV